MAKKRLKSNPIQLKFRGHDRVLCAFCNLELAEWGPKNDPIYEHGRRCPTCPVSLL